MKTSNWKGVKPLCSFVDILVPVPSALPTSKEQIPPPLEMQYALSALPPAMREPATVYLLNPKSGYQLKRSGTSGETCLLERTAWEHADFRSDIYVQLCYDSAGC